MAGGERVVVGQKLTMGKRLEVLAGCNQRGWVYKVGSLPNLPGFVAGTGQEFANNVFERCGLPEARQAGVITVFQRAGRDEEGIGMNQEPYYHPKEGLVLDVHDNICLADGVTAQEVVETVAGGVDYDPGALPSWQIIQTRGDELREARVQVVKTQLTSLQCARFNLDRDVGAIQEHVMAALAVTHLTRAAEIAPVVCVSLDNPNPDVIVGLKRDMEVMFGVERDSDGKMSDEGLLGMVNGVPALHSCAEYEMQEAIEQGVRLVHGDFATYRPESLLRGSPNTLREYIEQGGLIGVGVIPQSEDSIGILAEELGISMPSERRPYPILVDQLEKQESRVVQLVTDRYNRVVDYVRGVTELPVDQIRPRCVPSYLCGFGGTKTVEVAEYSLNLAGMVSVRIWG